MSARVTRTTISPLWVNLMALPMRLVRTWRTRPGSPLTIAGTERSMTAISSRPLACADPASRSTTSSTIARTSNSTSSISSFPASTFEKSRMSLMTGEQRLTRVAHRLRVVALPGVEVGLEQQVRHADDAVHRGADLVAHVREEVRLEPGRLGRLVPGVRHGRLGTRFGGDVGEGPDPARDAAVAVGNRLRGHEHDARRRRRELASRMRCAELRPGTRPASVSSAIRPARASASMIDVPVAARPPLRPGCR